MRFHSYLKCRHGDDWMGNTFESSRKELTSQTLQQHTRGSSSLWLLSFRLWTVDSEHTSDLILISAA